MEKIICCQRDVDIFLRRHLLDKVSMVNSRSNHSVFYKNLEKKVIPKVTDILRALVAI